MKKLLIFLAIALLAGAGYFTYDKWVKNENLTIWSFVPQNSIFVYESKAPLSVYQELKETGIWKNASNLPTFQRLAERINYLDTVVAQGAFSSTFQDSRFLISLHTVSSDDFDFLFITEIQNLTQHAYLSKAQSGFLKRTREYLDFTITELKVPDRGESFTYIFYKNYFIGSFTAFLVEDAIRAVGNKEIPPFNQAFPEVFTVSPTESDQGNLYLNVERYQSVLSTLRPFDSDLSLARSAFLDLKITDNLVNLSGFAFPSSGPSFLSTFSQPPGSAINVLEIVPNETSTLLHLNNSDPKKLGSDLLVSFQKSSPAILKERERLKRELDFDIAFSFSFLDEEIGLLTLESGQDRLDKLLILEVKDVGEALNFYNSAGERMASITGDTVYAEQFGSYQIRQLPFENYPYLLLGPIAKDFGQTFYLQHRNYVIFSNSLFRLKNLTIGIENENTWGKSLKIRKFIDQLNQSANVSYFVNTAWSWELINSSLKPDWSRVANDNEFYLKNFEFASVQFSAIDDKFYTNIAISQPNTPTGRFQQQTETIKSVSMANQLISKPYLVINHTTKEREVVLQDSSYTLFQFSPNFEVLWSIDLKERINSDIQQLDYYRNGKLQLVFTTPDQVHIIDRNGEYLPGFPKNRLSEDKIEHFSLIDYDNSKNYRYAIADAKGSVYLTDKDVKPLEGWAPKTVSSALLEPVKHFRIGGRDVFLLLQKSGVIHLLNRRAESISGFPVDVQADLGKGYYVKESNDLKTTTLTFVTSNGEFITMTLTGDILKRDQLYKPSTTTVFTLLSDVGLLDFILLRQTENKYEILDAAGKTLFTKDYFSGKPLYYHYYNLGGDTKLVALIEPTGSYLYLYDLEGNLITGRPLNASRPISLWKNGNEFQIYRSLDQNLELVLLNF